MKVKKKNITEIYASCKALSEIELPGKVWYAMLRNMQKMEKIVTEIDEAKEAIVKKYSVKDSEGKPQIVEKYYIDFGNNKDEVAKMLADIGEEDVEIEFHKINLSALFDLKLRGNTVYPLMDYVIFDDGEQLAVPN